MFEITVRLPKGLRGVCVADSSAPLPSAAAVAAPLPDARAEEDARLRNVLRGLSEAAQELGQRQQQRLEEMQQVAVELAVAVASRLVHERIESGDFAVEALVNEVIRRLEPESAATVYLHPEDLALLEKRMAGGKALMKLADLRLLGDPAIERGGCRAESGDASIFADLPEQLEGIRRHLLHALPETTVERRKGEPPLRRFPERRQTA